MSVVSDERTGETEPLILMFERFSEMTLFFKHLIPTHEQIDVGFDEFHVVKGNGMESKPCLRVIKASKSVETETETEIEEGIENKSVVIMTKKCNMVFVGFCFLCLCWVELNFKGD